MIEKQVSQLLREIPENITLVAAIKTRTYDEIMRAIDAGIKVVGENYIKEAVDMYPKIGSIVQWHMIGSVQTNKAKIIAETFDMVESLDSLHAAECINVQCEKIGKIMPVLLEINSGREPQKGGFLPEDAVDAVRDIALLKNLSVQGLMTMGPVTGTAEEIRPYFKITKEVFDLIKKENIENTEMKYLSMGMTDSYRVGIEEGANIIRIGSLIFGPRVYY